MRAHSTGGGDSTGEGFRPQLEALHQVIHSEEENTFEKCTFGTEVNPQETASKSTGNASEAA